MTGKQCAGVMRMKETVSKDYINILVYINNCRGSTFSYFSPSFAWTAFPAIAQDVAGVPGLSLRCRTIAADWALCKQTFLPAVLFTRINFIPFSSPVGE